jgi:alanyl-tRNA synthetase
MENKLYYQSSYIQSFSTKLMKQVMDGTGNYYVVLEETAFYPTGGGQPFDTGKLNDISVINVEEIDGEIRHYIKSPLLDTSSKVDGEINWERRFDHMQQHCGQHILSAAFEELYGYKTISFHLGQEELTIDLEIENLSDEEAAEVEKRANQIILENRLIETKWVSESELSQYPLRKQLSVTENIRLVIIPDYDYNGCGGTHPHSTGQVGSIKILDWEKQKRKIRVRFICGTRVLRHLHQKHNIILELNKLLNAPEQGLVQSLTRLLDTTKNTEKQLEDLRATLLQYEAIQLLNERTVINNRSIIMKIMQDRSMKELQKLAKLIIDRDEEAIVFLVSEIQSQIQVVAGRGKHMGDSMKDLLNKLLPLINGRGGGNDAFAQGGGEAIITGQQFLENGISEIENLL